MDNILENDFEFSTNIASLFSHCLFYIYVPFYTLNDTSELCHYYVYPQEQTQTSNLESARFFGKLNNVAVIPWEFYSLPPPPSQSFLNIRLPYESSHRSDNTFHLIFDPRQDLFQKWSALQTFSLLVSMQITRNPSLLNFRLDTCSSKLASGWEVQRNTKDYVTLLIRGMVLE